MMNARKFRLESLEERNLPAVIVGGIGPAAALAVPTLTATF